MSLVHVPFECEAEIVEHPLCPAQTGCGNVHVVLFFIGAIVVVDKVLKD